MQDDGTQEWDVIVIGAGMTGLSAATHLRDAGRSVLVLEAQDRVGGRVETRRSHGARPLDLGAQSYNRDMTEVVEAVRRFGLTPIRLPEAEIAAYDGLSTDEAETALDAVEDLYEKALGGDPMLQPLIDDPMTSLSDALAMLDTGAEAHAIIASQAAELWGMPPEVLQFRHAIEIARRYESYRDDWEYQLAEGMGAIADQMAAAIGDNLRLGTPVTLVRTTPTRWDGVVVGTAGGEHHARAAILAVQPTAAPAFLPDEHWALPAISQFRNGDMIKLHLLYETRFWARRHTPSTGISTRLPGLAVADTTLGPIGTPVLTAFIGGPEARALTGLTETDRWYQISEALSELLGEEAAFPIERVERVWVDDPWSGGAYNAHVTVGTAQSPAEDLRVLTDSVLFACSELSHGFPGFVEGALRQGRSAAERMDDALGTRFPFLNR